jgi:hypothetical protein
VGDIRRQERVISNEKIEKTENIKETTERRINT